MTAVRTALQLDRMIAFIQAQPLPLDIRVDEWKDPRTLPQNNYLFGVCYPPLGQKYGFTNDEIHEWMCGKNFGWVDHKVPRKPSNPDGIESRPFRTTTRNEHGKRDVLKKKEFSAFVETVHRVAAQAGVFIPEAWAEEP